MNYLFKIGNQAFALVSYKNMVAVGVCALLPPVLKITCDIHEVDKSTWNGMGRKLTTDELKKLDGYENTRYDVEYCESRARQ